MLNWPMQVISLEVRKIMAYRSDFWVTQIGNVIFNLVISYYLWKSIFYHNDVTEMNGYDLNRLVFYYLTSAIVSKGMLGQDIGFLSREIYEGSLNKYLVYPMSVFFYKHLTFLVYTAFQGLQMFIILLIKYLILDNGSFTDIPIADYSLGFLALMCSASLFFIIACTLESIAFWAEYIWSLMVAFRMSCNFLGGTMLPLIFFPEWAQKILMFTPFPYIVNFPIKIFMSEYDSAFVIENLKMLTIWYVIGVGVFAWVWNRGKYHYTGVGI
jgi:ABC-2 type transport system permease protein